MSDPSDQRVETDRLVLRRLTEDEVRGRIMGGVQMLVRVGLGAGALGMGAIANSVDTLNLGLITLDGNQVGLIVGGSLIVFGAFAATGAMRRSAWADTANRQATA